VLDVRAGRTNSAGVTEKLGLYIYFLGPRRMLQALGTGATGLEPATSGVTGRHGATGYDWLRPGITG
jgi:hypothetical protein